MCNIFFSSIRLFFIDIVQAEALAGRFAAPALYTPAVKRRESRAQLARLLAQRAVAAKDRW
jgi:hypothetical protein